MTARKERYADTARMISTARGTNTARGMPVGGALSSFRDSTARAALNFGANRNTGGDEKPPPATSRYGRRKSDIELPENYDEEFSS